MSVQANSRCVRCVTKVPMGATFCDDCHEAVEKFNRKMVCWHCAEDHAEAPANYCGNCGAEVNQTEPICVPV